MDIFEAIRGDHEIIRDLLEKLQNRATRSRRTLAARMKDVITVHQEAEESAFYPLLLDEKDAREDALESLEEHNVINFVLRELDETALDDERWRPKLIVLRELYEHHIDEEEEDLFGEAQDLLTDEQAQDAGKEFLSFKEQSRVEANEDEEEDEEEEVAEESRDDEEEEEEKEPGQLDEESEEYGERPGRKPGKHRGSDWDEE